MSHESSHVDPQRLRRACAKFATGITILTACDRAGVAHGMTANSFTSVSLDPPLVLVCVDYRARIINHLRETNPIGINVLGEHQRDLSARFAGPGEDRFLGVTWEAGATGAPLLTHALASIEAVITQLVKGGDHAIIIAEVKRVRWSEGRPLLYFDSDYWKLEGV